MKIRKLILFFMLLFVATPELFAWGVNGHRIVAEIAYANLTCRARHHVDKALGKRGIIYYSTWADEIKSDTIYPSSYDWHFQNLPAGLSHENIDTMFIQRPTNSGALFYALDSISNRLREGNDDNPDDIKFIVHLIGDMFQPMHMGHPEDKGGNRVQINWFSQNTNLHSVWDGNMVSTFQMSNAEMVRFLNDRYASKKRDIRRKTINECLYDTYALQNAIYDYQNLNDKNTYHYTYRFKKDAEWQLYVAGIKLAQWLNEIY